MGKRLGQKLACATTKDAFVPCSLSFYTQKKDLTSSLSNVTYFFSSALIFLFVDEKLSAAALSLFSYCALSGVAPALGVKCSCYPKAILPWPSKKKKKEVGVRVEITLPK